MVVPSSPVASPAASAASAATISPRQRRPYASVRRSRRGQHLPSTPRSAPLMSRTPPTPERAVLASPKDKARARMGELWPGEIGNEIGGGRCGAAAERDDEETTARTKPTATNNAAKQGLAMRRKETLSGPGGWRMVVEVDSDDNDDDDDQEGAEEEERRDNAAAASSSISHSASASASASTTTSTTVSLEVIDTAKCSNANITRSSPAATAPRARNAFTSQVMMHHQHQHHHQHPHHNIPPHHHRPFVINSAHVQLTNLPSDVGCSSSSYYSEDESDSSDGDSSDSNCFHSHTHDDDDDGSFDNVDDDDDGSASIVSAPSISSSMFDNDVLVEDDGDGGVDAADEEEEDNDDEDDEVLLPGEGSSGSWSIDHDVVVGGDRDGNDDEDRDDDNKTLDEILDEDEDDVRADDDEANDEEEASANDNAVGSIISTDLDLDSPRNISEYYARGAQNALGLVLNAAGMRGNDNGNDDAVGSAMASSLSQADITNALSAIDTIDQVLAKSASMVGATTSPRTSTSTRSKALSRDAKMFTFSDVDNDEDEDVSTRASEDYDDDDGDDEDVFSDDLGSATEDDLDESLDEDLSLTDGFGEYYDDDDEEEGSNGDDEDDRYKVTSPPTSPLLVHGVLPSGRPLVYERKAGEQIILKGVLPSGRRVDISESEACLLSEQLIFDTYSPRSAKSPRGGKGGLTVLPIIADDGKSKNIASPSNFLGRGLGPYTTEDHARQAVNGNCDLVADDSMLEETPVIANGKNVIPSPSEDVLNMTFPLELAQEDMMAVEREERAQSEKMAREKKGKKGSLANSSSDDTSTQDTENAAIMKTYLKRMQLFDTAQRMGDGSELPKSPPVASSFDVKALQIDRVDAVLLEPKKDLRDLIDIINGTDVPSSPDASLPAVESRDDCACRRGSDLSGIETIPTAATEPVENLKQATVRRENACGLLCMMVRSSSAKSTIGHTRGVIPALSAALVDKNASVEQKHRCLNTLILLSQDSKVRSIMLRFSALTNVLKALTIDESPQVRQLVCSLLVNLNKDKSNRIIVGKFFLGRAMHIIELASAFDNVLPHRGRYRSGEAELTTVLSDMTMDRSLEDDDISANDTTCVAGNLRADECDEEEAKTCTSHEVYFQARSSALKVLLDLSNVAKLTTVMARHENLLATLLCQAGSLKASDNLMIMAILTNLTRHPANTVHLASNGSFVSTLNNTLSTSSGEEGRKCALYALRNLTVDHKAQGLIIAHKRLLLTLSDHYSKSTVALTRVEILRVLQNLSNYPTFFLLMSELKLLPALISSIESPSTPDEEKQIARDIIAASSKWAWSSSHTATQAKAIYLGEDLGKSFGYRNPPQPYSVRTADQWE